MIYLVAGTRPEVIKLAPVWSALVKTKTPVTWVWTNQQPDLGPETFRSLGINVEMMGIDLQRSSSSLTELMAKLTSGLHFAIDGGTSQDIWVVQGDTLTAAVAAQQAFLAGRRVCHVEAGLRSWDVTQPFPEEACRIWIDAIATVKFAPTQEAMLTLSGQVYLTGNTVIDALSMVKPERLWSGKYGVVTLHRRENKHGVENVCKAVRQLLKVGVLERVIWPVHPNPMVKEIVPISMERIKGCEVVRPLPYDQMVNMLRFASLIMTDSGGIQEEALGLNVPCLVLREVTERPEGVMTGGLKLVGTDAEKIVGWATWLMSEPEEWQAMSEAANPYGDGKAGARIATVLRSMTKGAVVKPSVIGWVP